MQDLDENININKNLRPFSGVERDRPELVQKNVYVSKDMVTKEKECDFIRTFAHK